MARLLTANENIELFMVPDGGGSAVTSTQPQYIGDAIVAFSVRRKRAPKMNGARYPQRT
jgi:hypothetical protein